MPSSEILRRVALVRTAVSDERIASIIRVTSIGGNSNSIYSQRASVASYCQRCSYLADSCHLDDGGDTFLRNVGSYTDHTA
jgi:hypothetical protein